MPGGDPPIFKCSHVLIKRQLFTCVEVTVLMGSPVVQEHPQGLISSGGPPSIRRTHSYRNLPYNILLHVNEATTDKDIKLISILNSLLMNTLPCSSANKLAYAFNNPTKMTGTGSTLHVAYTEIIPTPCVPSHISHVPESWHCNR
jgi:hypothetical protein